MAMNVTDRRRYALRAQIAKALAHPSRLLILDLLADGERCVADLTGAVGADQSTVSKHLAVLRAAGLVSDRRDGAMSFYRVACPCLSGFFDCIERVLQQNLKRQQELVLR